MNDPSVSNGPWHDVGPADLPVGEQRCQKVADTWLLIVQLDEGPVAIKNECPHAGAALFGGDLRGRVIVCPLHAFKYDLKTGRDVEDPFGEGLTRYDCREREGRIEVRLDVGP